MIHARSLLWSAALACACCAWAGVLALPAHGQAAGTVVGRVVDAETDEPVEWTQILLEEANRSTAARDGGTFELLNIPAGLYTLKAFRIGYEPLTRSVSVPAGDTLRLTLRMSGTPVEAGEVVVEGTREEAPQLADAAMELEGKALRRHLGATIAETLKDEPGLAMRSMGPAPARPVLRGLGGERLLVLEDGGRTGDLSATSTDHAVVIDPLTAERVEVIRGPAALVYGSNTLGGVVNVVRGFIPSTRSDAPHATLTSQLQTVNRGYAAGGSVAAPVGSFAVRADGSMRRSSDVHTPAGTLDNTALETYNTSVGASLVRPWGYAGASGGYYRSSYGIPGGFVGAHPNGVNIEVERRHAEARAELYPGLSWVPRLEIDGSYSWFLQQEFEASDVLGTEFGLLSYHGSAVAHTAQYGPFRKGAVGVWGERRDFAAGGLIFTPASIDWQVAAFAYQDIHFDVWTLQAGLRLDHREVAPKEERTSNVIGAIRARSFTGLSGALSGIWHPSQALSVGATAMRSVRVPGIEELYSEGPHLAAYSFEVGDPTLSLERGRGLESFARYRASRVSGSLAFYRNAFASFIFPRNTGEVNFRTLLPIYQTTGAPALIWGGEGSVEVQLSRRVSLELSGSYVRGTFTDTGAPIPFMPPFRGGMDLGYRLRSWTFGSEVRTATRQERVGDFEQPTDGYVLMDAYAQYFFTTGEVLHTIDLRVDNVGDTEYRDHLSRVKSIMPEPGRSLRLLYKIFF